MTQRGKTQPLGEGPKEECRQAGVMPTVIPRKQCRGSGCLLLLPLLLFLLLLWVGLLILLQFQ